MPKKQNWVIFIDQSTIKWRSVQSKIASRNGPYIRPLNWIYRKHPIYTLRQENLTLGNPASSQFLISSVNCIALNRSKRKRLLQTWTTQWYHILRRWVRAFYLSNCRRIAFQQIWSQRNLVEINPCYNSQSCFDKLPCISPEKKAILTLETELIMRITFSIPPFLPSVFSIPVGSSIIYHVQSLSVVTLLL